jgi:hypothetical protein
MQLGCWYGPRTLDGSVNPLAKVVRNNRKIQKSVLFVTGLRQGQLPEIVVLDVGGSLLLGKIGIVDFAEAATGECWLGRLLIGLVGEWIGLCCLFSPIGLRDVSGRRVRAGSSHGAP